jgi:hypothetical protein
MPVSRIEMNRPCSFATMKACIAIHRTA